MEQLDYVGVMFSLIMQLSCFGVFVVPIGEVHRSMLEPPIDEPSIPLDSWRGILARGGPLPPLHCPMTSFYGGFWS